METAINVMQQKKDNIRTSPPEAYGDEERGVVLLPSDISEYILKLKEQGRVDGTVYYYQRALNKLYDDLPEDKMIHRDSIRKWRERMMQDGYAARTINSFVTIVNGFLEYLGVREYQFLDRVKQEREAPPELSRAEYIRLLSTAKLLENEKGYLLIKLFATTGILVQELPKVTVESVTAGKLIITSRGDKRIVHIPDVLKDELLTYAKRNLVTEGPIFVTSANTPMARNYVTSTIQKVCADANIPTEKVSPRSLKKLYQTTMSGIEANISILVKQAYDRLLDDEQLQIGWGE